MDAAQYDRERAEWLEMLRTASVSALLKMAGDCLKANQSIRATHYREGPGGPDPMGQADFHESTQRIQDLIEEIDKRDLRD